MQVQLGLVVINDVWRDIFESLETPVTFPVLFQDPAHH